MARKTITRVKRVSSKTAQARRQLFAASGVVEASRLALASKFVSKDLESAIAGALQTAVQLIDDVAATLGGDN